MDRHVAPDGERLLASLAYSELGASVATTIVGGNVVVDEGRPVHVDPRLQASRATALQERIHAHHEKRAAIYSQWEAGLTEAEALIADIDIGPERRLI